MQDYLMLLSNQYQQHP